MENIRTVIISILVSSAFLLMPFSVYAYHTSAHYDLTGKTLLSYEKLFGDVFTSTELTGAAQGAVGEDEGRRPTRHFYDPINNIGLLDHWMSSKEWAQDTKEQAKYGSNPGNDDLYFSADTDYSWNRAIYEYTYGDKERGMETLGHILHLIQDTTVPAHVRNDDHLNKWGYGDTEPYEEFTTGTEVPSLNFTATDVPNFVTLDDAFDQSATFTNTNFLSEDTIFEGFDNPARQNLKLIRDDKLSKNEYFAISNINDKEIKLLKVVRKRSRLTNKIEEKYFLRDSKNLILTDYWNTLSKQAVLNGMGVIKLFFAEVEKEKESGALLAQSKKTWGEVNGLKHLLTGFNLAKNLYGSSLTSDDVKDLLADGSGQSGAVAVAQGRDAGEDTQAPSPRSESGEAPHEEEEASVPPVQEYREPVPDLPDEPQESVDEANETERVEAEEEGVEKAEETTPDLDDFLVPVPISPGYGGGGGGGGGAAQTSPAPQESTEESAPSDTIAPEAPTITSPADFSITFTSATIDFAGTAEATSTISTDFSTATTSTDSSGSWALTLEAFPQGTSTVQFFARDEAGNTSAATSTTLYIDSEASAPTLAIAECANSLGGSCLIATTTLSISWDSTDADLDYFVIDANGSIATTTATSTLAIVPDQEAYTFSVSARDTSGNYSATTTARAEINMLPVVINEVAWAGTAASVHDEWVELYNNTDENIDLANWLLYTEDLDTEIALSGSIPAHGYYLIERQNGGEVDEATESPVTDVPADLWASFGSGLSNSGEQLILARMVDGATTTVDYIPACNNWCVKGTTHQYKTMERFDSHISGSDWSNWGTNSGKTIRNGRDIGNGYINGTPKAKNYFSYLLNRGGNIHEDIILEKKYGSYLVDDTDISIDAGKTLTIEPGVVLKFNGPKARLSADGNITANGLADEPIVFTSFYDDEYGGDMNGDGMCEPDNTSSTADCPHAGAWYGVVLSDTSTDSSFDHTVFRYGGKYYNGGGYSRANLYVNGTSPAISNSIFEYAAQYGLYIANSNSTISNNIFRNNAESLDSVGLYGGGEMPVITGNTFEANNIGLRFGGGAPVIENNIFTANTQFAIYIPGNWGGTIAGNSGSGNALNGILLSGTIASNDATSTLNANALPYILNETPLVVNTNSALVVEPGVVIKTHDVGIAAYGRLELKGSAGSAILITSVFDDSDGNDALNDGATIGTRGEAKGISLTDTNSLITHTELRFMDTALSYHTAPIDLSDVHIAESELGILATPDETIIRAENVSFENNTEDSLIAF